MKHINVAVAVILNREENKVLLTKRLPNKHLAGYWEFPGGKVEENESIEKALIREIKEEIGVTLHSPDQFQIIKHEYDTHSVTLHIYKTSKFSGKIDCLEVESYEWASINKLHSYQLPPANIKIIKNLQLNSIYAITREDFLASDIELNKIRKLLVKGIDLLQIRLPDSDQSNIEDVLEKLQSANILNKIIINSYPELVEKFNLQGLHLKSSDLLKLKEKELDDKFIVGASCHNEAEIKKANQLDLDYIFISPIKKTKLYSEDKLLGWRKLSELIKLAKMPVYALGGLNMNDITQAQNIGARGIAMIRDVWSS